MSPTLAWRATVAGISHLASDGQFGSNPQPGAHLGDESG
jgi:hypothetical protein